MLSRTVTFLLLFAFLLVSFISWQQDQTIQQQSRLVKAMTQNPACMVDQKAVDELRRRRAGMRPEPPQALHIEEQ